MQSNRHQLISGDLSEHPRPGEKEIWNQPIYSGHLERADSFTAATELMCDGEKGAGL